MKAAFLAAVLVAVSTFSALGQQAAPGAAPAMTMPPIAADASPSSQAFKAAGEKMMRGMMTPPTGNPDQDFVAGMLPHHQGAVDMAKIELQFGTNPELRRLARGIITAQEKEIAEMKAWQLKHPVAN